MKLQELVETYIAFKGSLGMRYRSQSAVLRAYCRAMGDIDIEEVRPSAVLAFITGTGPVTNRWLECYRVLDGFYRYAIGRGFTKRLRSLRILRGIHRRLFHTYIQLMS
jgi:integrase/recombinase XerD